MFYAPARSSKERKAEVWSKITGCSTAHLPSNATSEIQQLFLPLLTPWALQAHYWPIIQAWLAAGQFQSRPGWFTTTSWSQDGCGRGAGCVYVLAPRQSATGFSQSFGPRGWVDLVGFRSLIDLWRANIQHVAIPTNIFTLLPPRPPHTSPAAFLPHFPFLHCLKTAEWKWKQLKNESAKVLNICVCVCVSRTSETVWCKGAKQKSSNQLRMKKKKMQAITAKHWCVTS